MCNIHCFCTIRLVFDILLVKNYHEIYEPLTVLK